MLLIKNIGLLQTPVGRVPGRKAKQGHNLKLKNAAVLIDRGAIVRVWGDGGLIEPDCAKVIDANGALVTPGLVDCHTHLVFGGWRQHEIPLKLQGAGYLDILKAGCGILDTVGRTRTASFDQLYQKSLGFLDEMLAGGITTAEVKSGYGLNLEDELKQLRVAQKLDENQPMDLVSTFLGAHALPPEYSGRPDDYIDFLCETVLPAVARESLAEFCDVFCEKGVFTAEQSRKMLLAAKALGLRPKIHADEIAELGGSALAAEIGAISAEHLIATGPQSMAALASGGVTAVLLPGTSFYLGKDYAPARDMIDSGIPVAVATDFNPGSCPSYDLQLVMTLACLKYRMLPQEVLTAVTLNAACAIGRGRITGTLEEGKQADLVIWNAPDVDMLCYRFGGNLVNTVIKKGVVVKCN